jgi:hypothetical protein
MVFLLTKRDSCLIFWTLKQTGKHLYLGMFSQRPHVWLLAFVLGSGVGVGNSLSALQSVFQILESEYKLYFVKIWKCPTNLHLHKSNRMLCSGYGIQRSARRLHKSWLCGFITCCCCRRCDAGVNTLTLTWHLIVFLEGNSNLTLSIKVTEVTSCLQPYSLTLENKGTADRPSPELAAVIGGDMVTVNVEK